MGLFKNTIDPYRIAEHSNKTAYWICSKCGNHYSAVINSSVKGSGCKKCSIVKTTNGSNKTRVEHRGGLATNYPLLLMGPRQMLK